MISDSDDMSAEQSTSAALSAEICDAVLSIESLTKDVTYRSFMKNTALHEELMALISQIQDAAEKLPDDSYPAADLEFLRSLKENIFHPVFGLNPETLWDAVRLDLPYQ